MLKKMTVLAMAVGVLAALTAPTSAPAAWEHNGAPISEDVTINFTGNARFQGGLGGVECQLTPSLVFYEVENTTGTVERFTAHPTDETTNCKGLGGLSACQIHNLTPQHPKWQFHTILGSGGEAKIQVTTGDITSQATGGFFCLVKHINLTAAGGQDVVTLLPNQPDDITGGQVHGNLQADIQTNSGTVHKETVTVSGSFTIKDPSKKHTYDI